MATPQASAPTRRHRNSVATPLTPAQYPPDVCLSHLRWDFVFQRPQHLLTRCARLHRVFYIEEPLERIAPRGVLRADWSWTDSRLAEIQALGLAPIAGLVHHGSGPRYSTLLDSGFPSGSRITRRRWRSGIRGLTRIRPSTRR